MLFDRAFHVAVAGGTLYFGSSADGKVTALDAATGEPKWSYYTGAPVRLAPVEVRRAVHGRDAGNPGEASRELSVQIRMDQMGVQEVRPKPADLAPERAHEQRVGVRPGGDDRVGHPERAQPLGEFPRSARGGNTHVYLEPGLGERGEERKQVALRAPDPGCFLDVENPHFSSARQPAPRFVHASVGS
jgi:hypothetical protein